MEFYHETDNETAIVIILTLNVTCNIKILIVTLALLSHLTSLCLYRLRRIHWGAVMFTFVFCFHYLDLHQDST